MSRAGETPSGRRGAGSAAPPPAAAAAVQQRLTAEVLRKLRLATEAEEKDDRDVICAEVFADITESMNRSARESTGALYRRWYELLAPHLCRCWRDSEALLGLLRQLWGQPFAAPTYALLLHQWLLVHPGAGGVGERLKLVNVLCAGARQLFLGDVEAGRTAFQPLFSFVSEQVVLEPGQRRLDALPLPGREALMGLAAAFLPYYCSREELLVHLGEFPSPHHTMAAGGHAAGEGADFALDRITDVLSKEIRTEPGLLRYLHMLLALRGRPHLALLSTATRVRLQGELYLLAQAGGPRYAPRRVNRLAQEALDALFPAGRRTRRLISFAFRSLHPQEWPWYWMDAVTRLRYTTAAALLEAWAALAAACSRVWQAAAACCPRWPQWQRPALPQRWRRQRQAAG